MPGDQAKVYNAAAVKRAFGGKSIRQYDSDVVLFGDGSIETDLVERLDGEKRKDEP